MALTVANIYSVRFGPKIPLPKIIQENIAKLRITPVTYKPVRPQQKHYRPRETTQPVENWREKALATYVSKVKDKGDPDYFEVFGLLNKISGSNMAHLSESIAEIIKKRDQEFRLRIVNLLFDKAIRDLVFASVLADCAVCLQAKFPEISEDLWVQSQMFTKLYDVDTTLVFPASSDPEFDGKVIEWMNQKTKRKGYAKFLTQLFVRELISEELMIAPIQQVLTELRATASQKHSQQTEENTSQYADFLFESAKILPASTNIRKLISESLKEILAVLKADLPSLCMRSRFRLEDTLKCVQ